MYIYHGVIFAYDKYGDYGLVGFFAFDERKTKRKLEHFYFSCRILNMGIEQSVYRHLRENCGIREYDLMESRLGNDTDTSYIRVVHNLDERVKYYIDNKMDVPEDYRTVVSAGCESGIIGHYLPDKMKPIRFDLLSIADRTKASEDIESVIYTIYSDYTNTKWHDRGGFSYGKFQQGLKLFIERHTRQQEYLILASEKKSGKKEAGTIYRKLRTLLSNWLRGKSRLRCKRCNAIVRKIAIHYSNVKLIETTNFVEDKDEQFDARHFERIVFKRLCGYFNS